jgi:hypothetical protein
LSNLIVRSWCSLRERGIKLWNSKNSQTRHSFFSCALYFVKNLAARQKTWQSQPFCNLLYWDVDKNNLHSNYSPTWYWPAHTHSLSNTQHNNTTSKTFILYYLLKLKKGHQRIGRTIQSFNIQDCIEDKLHYRFRREEWCFHRRNCHQEVYCDWRVWRECTTNREKDDTEKSDPNKQLPKNLII